jgi:ABC-2 type transport system permease protein
VHNSCSYLRKQIFDRICEAHMKDKKYSNWHTNLRIVWAIARKDILEAIKNRQAISVVITAFFIVIMYSFIPTLTSLDNPTNVLIYDAAGSPLSKQLEDSQALEVYTYPTQEIMLEKLAHGEVPELGLVIPADFEQSLATAQVTANQPTLTGYVLYWVTDRQAARLAQEVEAEITHLTGEAVVIHIAPQRLIPNPDQHSLGMWVGAALVFLVIYTSLSLISNLMLEEKLTRTLDTLRVSPASSWHIVMAKAITGLFYCLLGIAVTLAINYKIILHWWLLIPALMLGTLFTLPLGLMVGSIIEERGQLALWTFGLLIPLFVPVFLSDMPDLLPNWLNQLIVWIPSVTFFQLLQASFSWVPPVSTLLGQFAWLFGWAIAGLAGAVWIIRWKEHQAMGDQKTLIAKIIPSRRSVSYAGEPAPLPSKANTTIATSSIGVQVLDQGIISARPASVFRIVGTIAAKDIRQSIRNKLILSILLGTTLLVAGNALLLRGLSAHTSSQANLVASSLPVLSSMISISLMALGVALVPLLMLEEKEAHTLETLLVSPARYIHVIIGKALAGSVYCLSGGLVILAAYYYLIIHWQLALLALLLATAFVVALGLLVGMLSNNPTTVGMWAAVIMTILIIPAIMVGMVSLGHLPWIQAILTNWPSTAIVKLFQLAMVAELPHGVVIANASVVACAAILLYLVTWWLVRRTDR